MIMPRRTGVVIIDDLPFQIIVVPYLSPDIRAWILLGFAINQQVADDLKQMVNSEISFFIHTDDQSWRITHTTLAKNLSQQLQQHRKLNFDVVQSLKLYGQEYVTLLTAIDNKQNVSALLQRSLDDALEPYLRLRERLQLLFLLGLILSVLGAIAIARKVTKPVKDLTIAVKQIEGGDYQTQITTNQQDEIGKLSHSFNQMAKGLKEKEKVRSLLGKVVSKEIAEELLSKDIELGGEEIQATILFSDIRDFTSLCEGVSPKFILEMLNIYLTQMSDVIERQHGVIDKYIGDAIMAIFGAPVVHGDDANSAVAAALLMVESLDSLNQNRNKNLIDIGIGLNTGRVVAGNMGSMSRLNYTVIGDGVNLASRLEGLTKYYGIAILVSETTKDCAGKFGYQEIDRVKVKGKKMQSPYFAPSDI